MKSINFFISNICLLSYLLLLNCSHDPNSAFSRYQIRKDSLIATASFAINDTGNYEIDSSTIADRKVNFQRLMRLDRLDAGFDSFYLRVCIAYMLEQDSLAYLIIKNRNSVWHGEIRAVKSDYRHDSVQYSSYLKYQILNPNSGNWKRFAKDFQAIGIRELADTAMASLHPSATITVELAIGKRYSEITFIAPEKNKVFTPHEISVLQFLSLLETEFNFKIGD